MEGYVSDQEQVEALKKWWRENGTSVIFGIAIGLAALGGWRYWQERNENLAMAASAHYAQLLADVQKDDTKAAIEKGEAIINQYPSTPYASFAAFEIARVRLEQGDATAARAHLQWVVDHTDAPETRHLARLRLARVMTGAGEHDAALALLQGAGDTGAFTSLYQELMGDIHLAKGDLAQARAAYRKAQETLDAADAQRGMLLELKLTDLGTDDAGGATP